MASKNSIPGGRARRQVAVVQPLQSQRDTARTGGEGDNNAPTTTVTVTISTSTAVVPRGRPNRSSRPRQGPLVPINTATTRQIQPKEKTRPTVKENHENHTAQVKKKKSNIQATSTNIDSLCSHLAATVVQDPTCKRPETTRPPLVSVSDHHLPEVIVHRDVDEDDKENPECCTEYVQEIFEYMKECETREIYIISDSFLSKQTEWSSWHRSILINWLVDVHLRYQFVQETLFITVDCFDRYVQVGTSSI